MRALFVVCGDPDPSIDAAHGPYLGWFRAALDGAAALIPFDPRSERTTDVALGSYDAIVVSGSPHSAYEPHAWIGSLGAMLRHAVMEREIPVLGVCFGHQLIAMACGGRVAKNPRGREIGTVSLTLTDDGLRDRVLGPLGSSPIVQVTHCDTVTSMPPSARLLATSARDDCQAYSFGSALCVQFHPELTPAIMRSYLEARRAIVSSEGFDVDALIREVRDTNAGIRVLNGFARAVDERIERH